MQKLVGKTFIANAEQRLEIGALPKGKKRAAQRKIDSPVLLQLLTFSRR